MPYYPPPSGGGASDTLIGAEAELEVTDDASGFGQGVVIRNTFVPGGYVNVAFPGAFGFFGNTNDDGSGDWNKGIDFQNDDLEITTPEGGTLLVNGLPVGGGGGGGGGGSAHYFGARATGSLGTASGFRAVVYASEVYDSSGAYDPSTGIFTAPATGVYHFDATLYVASGGRRLISLFVNGSEDVRGIDDTSGNTINLTLSTDIPLDAGDTVGVQVYTANSVDHGDSGTSRFSGHGISV